MQLIDVLIDLGSSQLASSFTYQADFPVQRGERILVPFASRAVIGIVNHVLTETECQAVLTANFEIKKALQPVTSVFPLSQEQFELAEYLAATNISPVISNLALMVPNLLQLKAPAVQWPKYYQVKAEPINLTSKQQAAYQYLLANGPTLQSEFRKLYANQVKPLINKAAIELIEKPLPTQPTASVPLKLTAEQTQAYQEIQAAQLKPVLLHGVTGSGKTELYLQLAQAVLETDRQGLILVPEISLTPAMIERVETRFPNQVAIYHSGLSAQKRLQQYSLVAQGQVKLVVGTRSAVFLPFQQLGLIVLDEEHDYSYKQSEAPRYHCRDVVLWRARYHQAQVVLGSATPSFESYARALKGVFQLVVLTNRINHSFPQVKLIDTKRALASGEHPLFTQELLKAIKHRLANKEQVLLFLNRRGHTPILRCQVCQQVVMCQDCDVAMTYHQDEQQLVCHFCGKTQPIPRHCPTCGQTGLTYYGYGTQKAVEELTKFFPSAKIVRMDRDSVAKKGSHQAVLDEFQAHGDILIGTQMIAKGLDYPRITLVGILNGDAYLIKDDFRSIETTFALLMQASGRSGRGSLAGEVYLQAYNPLHYALKLAQRQDYDRFFHYEMQFRKLGAYPPYTYLIAITLLSTNEAALNEVSEQVGQALKQLSWRILGPSQLPRLKKQYRTRLTIKGQQLALMIEQVRAAYPGWVKLNHQVSLKVDVNPLTWG